MTNHLNRRVGNRFERGSGVYACRVCARSTRSTGRGDNEGVKLCAECFDLGGEENSVSDTGDLYCSAENVLEMIAAVKAKGGDVSAWASLAEFAAAKLKEA
jgi:hypothetical protein